MQKFVWFLRIVCPFLFGITASHMAAAEPPHLAKADCWFDAPKERTVDCYRLDVPETRDFDLAIGPGKRLHLPVVIIRASEIDEESRPDPVIYLAGGPGDGAWLDDERIAWWWDFVASTDWARKRDLILFDQRGSGLVQPRIDCPEIEKIAIDVLASTDDAVAADLQRNAAAACGQRLLGEGFNPGAYTSRDGAADIHDLYAALKVPAWNVYGLSYGTRLALEYMRQYPGDIRSVLLDSVLPPEAQFLEDDASTTDRAFRMIFNACARQPDCAKAYGDLERRLTALVRRLDMKPLALQRPSPTGHGTIKVMVNGELLISRLFNLLYNRADIESVPQLIDLYDRDERDAIERDIDSFVTDYVGREDFGDAMFMAVHCQEEVPFNDMEKAIAAYRRYPLLAGLAVGGEAGSFAATCASWRKTLPVQPLRQTDTEPVASDLPTLIFSGLFDPVTPPVYGRMAASHLVNGFYLEFDGYGHDLIGNDPCANTIYERFLDDPRTPPRDSCLGSETPPDFLMPLK
ncbi:MAG: alpha/beta fold hydrolase [Proteobacteria bacterium]|nr:alpha/beta fold hydrolase [Pseudomonadota bacterium]